MAEALFLICERSFWQTTTRPDGMCVMRTAESVVLTPWPPLPEERYTSMRSSVSGISILMSSVISATTSIAQKEVCRRWIGVERADAHEAVHAALGLAVAVGVVALDEHGGLADAGLIAGLHVLAPRG